MFAYPRRIRYPTDKQVEIWSLNRDSLTGREIAQKKDVSPAFVSKTLKQTNELVKGLLENAARMNKIRLDLLHEGLGFARGHSHVFNVTAYITFSPDNGVQVWYEHEGECAGCGEFAHCREVLLQEFKERKLPVPSPTLRPTDLGELLFKQLEEMAE